MYNFVNWNSIVFILMFSPSSLLMHCSPSSSVVNFIPQSVGSVLGTGSLSWQWSDGCDACTFDRQNLLQHFNSHSRWFSDNWVVIDLQCIWIWRGLWGPQCHVSLNRSVMRLTPDISPIPYLNFLMGVSVLETTVNCSMFLMVLHKGSLAC